MTTDTRKCSRCKEVKFLTSFDGESKVCKACTTADQDRASRSANRITAFELLKVRQKAEMDQLREAHRAAALMLKAKHTAEMDQIRTRHDRERSELWAALGPSREDNNS